MGKSRSSSQYGGNLPAFHGVRLQRGYGLGGLLRGLFRAAVPLFKQGAKAVGHAALKTGSQVASDILQGGDIKTSLKNRTNQTRRELQTRAKQKALKMIGGGKSKGNKITKRNRLKKKRRKRKSSSTIRMKRALLEKKASFPRTSKGLTSLARREGYTF